VPRFSRTPPDLCPHARTELGKSSVSRPFPPGFPGDRLSGNLISAQGSLYGGRPSEPLVRMRLFLRENRLRRCGSAGGDRVFPRGNGVYQSPRHPRPVIAGGWRPRRNPGKNTAEFPPAKRLTWDVLESLNVSETGIGLPAGQPGFRGTPDCENSFHQSILTTMQNPSLFFEIRCCPRCPRAFSRHARRRGVLAGGIGESSGSCVSVNAYSRRFRRCG
jgi:hypothetical protein